MVGWDRVFSVGADWILRVAPQRVVHCHEQLHHTHELSVPELCSAGDNTLCV